MTTPGAAPSGGAPRDAGPPGVSRPELVLVPGMLGDADGWRDVAARVADVASIRIARIDLAGTVTELAAGVLAAAPGAFSVVGHSLGGIVALEMVRQEPHRIRRLALLNSSARPPTDAQRAAWRAWDERVAAGEFTTVAHELAHATLPASRPDLIDRNARMAASVGPDGFRRQLAAQQSRTDARPNLAAITAPTLVIRGDLDGVSPAELQQELATGIPDATLHVLENTGHMSPLESPDAVATLLRAWLSDQDHRS
ncbi:alpha/beta fold hydrolase [Cryptosporangium sp. NPDC048952]|uniref:alpha/beta fold hydrolase n=1 Tax=Cryptosporangium sp. NPDC048952 TaxID=3363961 RepID=UPI0037195C94